MSKPHLTLLPFAIPFAFPDFFLHSRWGTGSWILLAKLLLLFQIFPLFSIMDKWDAEDSVWHQELAGTWGSVLVVQPHSIPPPEEMNQRITAALRHIPWIQKTGEYFQHFPIYTSTSSCSSSSGWTNKQLRIFSASGFVWVGAHKKVSQNSTDTRTSYPDSTIPRLPDL